MRNLKRRGQQQQQQQQQIRNEMLNDNNNNNKNENDDYDEYAQYNLSCNNSKKRGRAQSAKFNLNGKTATGSEESELPAHEHGEQESCHDDEDDDDGNNNSDVVIDDDTNNTLNNYFDSSEVDIEEGEEEEDGEQASHQNEMNALGGYGLENSYENDAADVAAGLNSDMNLTNVRKLRRIRNNAALVERSLREDVIQVNCNSVLGQLHKNKFGSGGKGHCIRVIIDSSKPPPAPAPPTANNGVEQPPANETNNTSTNEELSSTATGADSNKTEKWMTPIEFENYCGKGNCRDWKRTIKTGGQPLLALLDARILVCHAVSCSCAVCNRNDSLIGPIKPFIRYRRRKKDEILAENAFKKFLSLKPPTLFRDNLLNKLPLQNPVASPTGGKQPPPASAGSTTSSSSASSSSSSSSSSTSSKSLLGNNLILGNSFANGANLMPNVNVNNNTANANTFVNEVKVLGKKLGQVQNELVRCTPLASHNNFSQQQSQQTNDLSNRSNNNNNNNTAANSSSSTAASSNNDLYEFIEHMQEIEERKWHSLEQVWLFLLRIRKTTL
jgi:hypothetical protein